MDSETTEKAKEQVDLSKPEGMMGEKESNILPTDDAGPRTTLTTSVLPLPDQTRRRVQTEKGQLNEINWVSKQLTRVYSKVKRQCGLVVGLLDSSSVEIMQVELTNLDKHLAEADELNNRLLGLLSEEAQVEQQNKHEAIDNEVFEVKQQTCEWLKKQEIERSSRGSSRSRSHASSRASRTSAKTDASPIANRATSHASYKSSNSSRSSKMSSKSETQRKLAKLKAEEEALHHVQAAKKEELECKLRLETAKMESERKRLQKKITEAKIENETFHEPDVLGQLPRRKHHTEAKNKTLDNNDSNNNNPGMMEMMLKLVDLHTAPEIDIDVFSGNPLEYSYFRASFRDVVEQKVLDPIGRLMRLLKYTSGDAKELIKHCIHEDEKQCYAEAIKLLDAEYGNQQILVHSYLKELKQWPPVKSNDSSGYKKLHRFLRAGLTYKRDGKLKELDSESIIRTCILSKLDRPVQEKWVSNVVRTREKKGKELSFIDVVKFVEH